MLNVFRRIIATKPGRLHPEAVASTAYGGIWGSSISALLIPPGS